MDKFKKSLSNLLKARFPYLYISTWEEERLINTIKEVAKDETLIKTVRNVLIWRSTEGIKGDGVSISDQTNSPQKALDFIHKYDEPSIFILLDFHVYLGHANRPPDFQIVRKLRDLIYPLKQSFNPKNVVFISPSLALPDELQKDITIVDFDLPSFDEIKDLFDDMIKVNLERGNIVVELSEDEKEHLVKASLGLTLQEAENAFARSMVDDGRIDISDLDVIHEEKSQIIKKTGLLEFIESDIKIIDVGGLENLKRWLNKRDKSWLESAKEYCLPSPKGLLITGVPGCGKSLVAKSISSMWRLPLLRLDISKVFSGIVGSSEENMRRSIKIAEAISPSILWIDEIEKGFSGIGSSGDSGTATRIFGTFLTWMQEKSKPVFVIATSNNIDFLPSEFLRKGRFDEIFFVDLPTYKERLDIFKVHLNKRLQNPKVKGEFEINNSLTNLAEITEGFSGSEIEQIVISGLFEAYSENRSVNYKDFENSVLNTIPLSVTQAEQIRSLREWANLRAVSATVQQDRRDYKPKEIDKKEDSADIFDVRGGRAIDF